MKIPRKLLMVERPDGGWNLLLEIDGSRTMSKQVSRPRGDELMGRLQDVILEFFVQNSGVI